MSNESVQWLPITDLDGTMLNHDSYGLVAAKMPLKCYIKNIPVSILPESSVENPSGAIIRVSYNS